MTLPEPILVGLALLAAVLALGATVRLVVKRVPGWFEEAGAVAMAAAGGYMLWLMMTRRWVPTDVYEGLAVLLMGVFLVAFGFAWLATEVFED